MEAPPFEWRASVSALLLVGSLGGCGAARPDPSPEARVVARSYVMGFSVTPPRPDTGLALRTIDLWAQRSDAALIFMEPPWAALLAGQDPESLVRKDPLGLAEYYRSKGLRLVANIDPINGLDRSSDAEALVDAGRSLAEPAVRELYVRYVAAFVNLVRPEFLGVASETNLIRVSAPPALYGAVVGAASAAAAAARQADAQVRLFSTVQVETAWGRLPAVGNFVGVARDRVDFPFAQILGLSSYPYLGGYAEPEDLPLDYYTRLVQDAPVPVMVIEGGWTSASLGDVVSSADEQRRFIARQALLLDDVHALGVFQITFTDLDLPALNLPSSSILPAFAFLGLVDVNLLDKPALLAWDATFRRALRQ